LTLADGQLWRGQWSATPPQILPVLGDVLRIEFRPAETQSAPKQYSQTQMQCKIDKPCCLVTHWVVLPQLVPLHGLSKWYQAAPNPATLDRLLALINRMEIPSLQDWLIRVFRHRNIALPFFQLPASREHHHNFPGGLLLHSLECAEWVERIAKISLSRKEAALAVCVALFHDLGKIETLRKTDLGRMVEHEVLSLTLLEPLLGELEKTWSQGAHALRQMLSWSSSSGKFPKFPSMLLVKMADQYSTALSARNMAFADLPAHYYWASLKMPHSVQLFNRIN
jgi:hypothetical protein